MAGRYIILVERDDDVLVPIVNTLKDGAMSFFRSRQEADESATRNLLCVAYPYRVIDVDEALT
ncbi:hypothetical protein EKL30_00890 [Candidimonas sp. SYP-B2681]|uniref:hypothetical protein n=1 Tax=Candidimonas sp. SYP-B2681 TaxID=2497686 RepID=UPI000F879B86|nr:hypothetical protein [Candidimonas sp. SYP-B2681]RTZ47595.1 hypothetical protein EKL30_00890 [Candidimonas sp. SYP-B2681]